MFDVQNVNVRRAWEECPRERGESRWQTLYATLNPDGYLVISKFTHETLGAPEAYVLLYERERDVIGLRPANLRVDKNAFPAKPRGRHGGRILRAYGMLREFGISLIETVRFHRCQLDNHGVLILDLKDTRPARKEKKGKYAY